MIDAETIQEMNEHINDDYKAIVGVIDALLSEIKVCDDVLYSDFVFNACAVFNMTKYFVDAPCDEIYFEIVRTLEYARGFVHCALLTYPITDELKTAIDAVINFGGFHRDVLADDADAYNREYMHRLADALRSYVADNATNIHVLFSDTVVCTLP